MIITLSWFGNKPNAETVFYIFNLFNQINSQYGLSLPLYFSRISQLLASFQRLDEVLQANEMNKPQEKYNENEKPCIILEDVSVSLMNNELLKGITVNISSPGLHVITGSVGSGKSSLLKVILREYHPVQEGKNMIITYIDIYPKYSV